MGSLAAMKKAGQNDMDKTGTRMKKLIAEGVEGYVSYQGSVSEYLYQIQEVYIRSYYLGSKLQEFFENRVL